MTWESFDFAIWYSQGGISAYVFFPYMETKTEDNIAGLLIEENFMDGKLYVTRRAYMHKSDERSWRSFDKYSPLSERNYAEKRALAFRIFEYKLQ
jgi:hypothetical protein